MGQPAAGKVVGDGTPRVGRGLTTRRALVAAALELFAAKGVEATSVDEITAAADVAKGTFYVHFQRKQDVLLEWAAQLVENLDTDSLPDDVPSALRQLGAQLATTMATGPRPVTGRMVREMVGNSAAWVHVLGERQPLWGRIIPIIERGQAAGSIRADMTPLRLSMALTILWLDNVVGWAERDNARPLPQAMELATDLFLGGAAVSSAA
ncbi:TetR/AcrR family transcriptional regulator [soil metagenome]